MYVRAFNVETFSILDTNRFDIKFEINMKVFVVHSSGIWTFHVSICRQHTRGYRQITVIFKFRELYHVQTGTCIA